MVSGVSHQMGLRPDESRRAQAALRGLLDKFTSQADLARALVMPDGHAPSQQAVSVALKPGGPVGVTLARAIAQALGITFDELVTGTRIPRATGDAPALYEQVPGWSEAAAQILERRSFPRYAVAAVGRMPVWVRPERVTLELAYDLLLVWMRHASLDERLAAEEMDLEEEKIRDAEAEEARRQRVARSGTVVRSNGAAEARPVAEPKRRR
jgi:hypothetical protein